MGSKSWETWRVQGPAFGAGDKGIPGAGEVRVYVPVCARARRPHHKPAEVWLLRACTGDDMQVLCIDIRMCMM
jgi:hypothetical protein